jgi:hypothetical protein
MKNFFHSISFHLNDLIFMVSLMIFFCAYGGAMMGVNRAQVASTMIYHERGTVGTYQMIINVIPHSNYIFLLNVGDQEDGVALVQGQMQLYVNSTLTYTTNWSQYNFGDEDTEPLVNQTITTLYSDADTTDNFTLILIINSGQFWMLSVYKDLPPDVLDAQN